MKKFIYESFLMFSIIVAGYFFISFISNHSPKMSNDYMAAMIDKHKRIREIKNPKVILAGGSSLAFGMDSQKLQNEFAVPVVNLGLHAGLGLDFIINELKTLIHKGDVVILSIEYFLGEGMYDLQNFTQDIYPEASKFYTKNIVKDFKLHIEKTRKNLNRLIQKQSVDTSSYEYSRRGFNQFGDYVSHLKQIPPNKLQNRVVFNYSYWKGIEILNNFFKYAQSRNVSVFFMYPNYPKSEFEKNRAAINQLHNDLLKNMQFEVLNTPLDLVFEDSLFFDTIYHLNGKGRELRTDKTIAIIKKNTNALKVIRAMQGAATD